MTPTSLPMAPEEARCPALGPVVSARRLRARGLWALALLGLLLAHSAAAFVSPRGRERAAIETRAAIRERAISRATSGRTVPGGTARGKTTC